MGGTFNNLQNIAVTTTNSDTRVLNINDAGPTDPVHFLDSLKTVVNGQTVPLKQYDIYLQANWQPLFNDITRNFARDIIKIGLVSHNGQQVYFNEQAYDYVPYPDAAWVANNPDTNHGPVAAAWVPAALLNLTNQQLWDTYGLAIGGVVAPDERRPRPAHQRHRRAGDAVSAAQLPVERQVVRQPQGPLLPHLFLLEPEPEPGRGRLRLHQ